MSKFLVCSGQVSAEEIRDDCHYAELWVGTHSKTPNLISDGMSLAEYVQLYPELLGERITKHHGATLPFLLKVLSIGHPLQLQIHPTKVLDITYYYTLFDNHFCRKKQKYCIRKIQLHS